MKRVPLESNLSPSELLLCCIKGWEQKVSLKWNSSTFFFSILFINSSLLFINPPPPPAHPPFFPPEVQMLFFFLPPFVPPVGMCDWGRRQQEELITRTQRQTLRVTISVRLLPPDLCQTQARGEGWALQHFVVQCCYFWNTRRIKKRKERHVILFL